MPMRNHMGINRFITTLLTGVTFAAMMLFLGTPRAAGYDDACHRGIVHADHKLHEAIEHNGYHSRQADHWRHELHEARERCWNEVHQWWDEHEHRWHREHDWDDRDHDRD
jgi:hypothetical protein